jgi:hypothetical protein
VGRRSRVLWTHEETAAYLRISAEVLEVLVDAGAGPTRYWVAGQARYDAGRVQAWLARSVHRRPSGRHAHPHPAGSRADTRHGARAGFGSADPAVRVVGRLP